MQPTGWIRGPEMSRCSICDTEYQRLRPLQSVCSPRCARLHVEQRKAAAKAKDKQLRIALTTLSKLLAGAQSVVNRYVRLRDHGKPCISCGATPAQKRGGTMDAGHFRSVGSAPQLRFFLPNIHAQCVRCNRDLSSNSIEYRKGLIERIGLIRVEQIEAMNHKVKWSREYVVRLKAVMSRRANRLARRLAR